MTISDNIKKQCVLSNIFGIKFYFKIGKNEIFDSLKIIYEHLHNSIKFSGLLY